MVTMRLINHMPSVLGMVTKPGLLMHVNHSYVPGVIDTITMGLDQQPGVLDHVVWPPWD